MKTKTTQIQTFIDMAGPEKTLTSVGIVINEDSLPPKWILSGLWINDEPYDFETEMLADCDEMVEELTNYILSGPENEIEQYKEISGNILLRRVEVL